MTAMNPDASGQAVVDAALVLLERMGLTPADLAAVPQHRLPVPTFAEYVPVVSAAVSAGTRRAYGSYWNRVIEHWGGRRLDEPTPLEIRQLMTYVKTHVVARRNARGGRSAEEHLVAALRCLYRRAVDDGLITEADNPARKVAKPRRLPTTRRALPDTRLAEINEDDDACVTQINLVGGRSRPRDQGSGGHPAQVQRVTGWFAKSSCSTSPWPAWTRSASTSSAKSSFSRHTQGAACCSRATSSTWSRTCASRWPSSTTGGSWRAGPSTTWQPRGRGASPSGWRGITREHGHAPSPGSPSPRCKGARCD